MLHTKHGALPDTAQTYPSLNQEILPSIAEKVGALKYASSRGAKNVRSDLMLRAVAPMTS